MTGTKQSDVAVSNGSGAVRTPHPTARHSYITIARHARRGEDTAPYRRWCDETNVSAFTLLEILIAVSIFSVVLVAINTVFYAALRLRNKTTQAIEDLTPTEHAVAIMKHDLMMTLPPGGSLSGQLTTTPTSGGGMGQSGAIEFFTSSGIISDDEPWGDAQKVSFYLRSPMERGRGKELVRAVTRNLLALNPESPEEELLLEDVARVQFSFFDGSQWRTTWDANSTSTSMTSTNQTTMPQVVQVQIELAPDEKKVRPPIRFIVPITTEPLSQVQTNSTSL